MYGSASMYARPRPRLGVRSTRAPPASASSVDPNGGNNQGDEAALRMGLDSTLDQFTADDYPGVGLRNLDTDGIWVLFSLDEAPEPGTALMLGLGLFGLGLRGRARRR